MSAPSHGPVSVLVVDNHEAVREGVIQILGRDIAAFDVVGAYADLAELPMEPGRAPDVVVLDLYLGRDDTTSVPWIPRLRDWGAAVLLYTSTEVAIPLREAVAAGAAGLTLKNDSAEELRQAVRAVAAGEFACSSPLAQALLTDEALVGALSPREVEVVRGLDDGLTQRLIARRHNIAESTVKEHLKSVRAKYLAIERDVTNSHSLVREARRDGWIRHD